jgi:tetratricopeptide (TPR) repeat protein
MDVVPERPSLNSKVEAYREAIGQLRAEIDRARDEKTQSDLPGRLLAALTARDEVKIALEDHTSDERKLLPDIVSLDAELRILGGTVQRRKNFDISSWHHLIYQDAPIDQWWRLGDPVAPLFDVYRTSINKLSAMLVTKRGNIRHLLSAALNARDALKTTLASNPLDAQSWRSRIAALDRRFYSKGLEILRSRYIELSSWLALMSAPSPLDSWWHLDDPMMPTLDVYGVMISNLSDAVSKFSPEDATRLKELLIDTLMARDALKASLGAFPAEAPSKLPRIAELDSEFRDLSIKAQQQGNFDISQWHNLLSENPVLDEWWHARDIITPAFIAYVLAIEKLSIAIKVILETSQTLKESNVVSVEGRHRGFYETSELPQLLAEALMARNSLRSALTTNPSNSNLWQAEVNNYNKKLYSNALCVFSIGAIELSSWLKLVTVPTPLEAWPHLDDPLTPTVDAYRVSIDSLSHTLANSELNTSANFPKLLIDILTARDALKASLIAYPEAAGPRLPEIMELDNQLYSKGAKALRSGKFDLSTSRSLLPNNELNTWWYLDDSTVTGRGDRSFLFKIMGVILFSISFAIITIKTQWLWDIGAQILGSVTAVAQFILGGALATTSGRELALRVFKALPVPWPRRLHAEAVLAAGTVFLGFTVLLYAVGIPLLASYLHDQGQIALRGRDLSRARSHLEAAVRIEPNYATSLTQLGILYRDIGSDDLAESTFERAISSDSRLVIAHNELADLYLDKAQQDKENAQYDKALRLLNHGLRAIRIGNTLDEIMPIESQKKLEFLMLLNRARLLIEQSEEDAALIDLHQATDLIKGSNFSYLFGPGNKVHTIQLYVLYANAYGNMYKELCSEALWNESIANWEIVEKSYPDTENSIQERRWYVEAVYWRENPAPPCTNEEN